LAVDNQFKPRPAVVKAMGYDAEVVDRQIKADRERAEALGTPPVVPPGPAAAPPAPTGE
jgi:hypothetical protein